MEATFTSVDPRGPEAQAALWQYLSEVSARVVDGVLSTADLAVDDFMPPRGTFLLGRLGDRVVGCGAVRALDGDIGEVKRMWIDPDFRGRGFGGLLLTALEDAARDLGYRIVRLDTNDVLVEAIRLYEAHGFRRIDRYNVNPDPTRFYEKSLS